MKKEETITVKSVYGGELILFKKDIPELINELETVYNEEVDVDDLLNEVFDCLFILFYSVELNNDLRLRVKEILMRINNFKKQR